MSDSRLEYISKQVLPILKKKWKHRGELKFEPMVDKKGDEHFQSIAIFGDIVIIHEEENDRKGCEEVDGETSEKLISDFEKVHLDDKHNERLGVLIKMQICDKIAMSWTNGGLNFFNEIFFYNDIVPYFSSKFNGIRDIIPDIIHGYFSDKDTREEDIIVLRNLQKENYKLAKSRTALSLEHILLALRKLAKFHACSYVMKSLDRATFMAKLNSLKLTKAWIHDPSNPVYNHFRESSKRALSYIDEIPEYKDKLSNFKHFYDNLETNIPKIYEPNEKMSVLVHGDFNRNNMFFKYETITISDKTETFQNDQNVKTDRNETNEIPGAPLTETPVDVKFFDWADIIYASPVLDLGFFLFMNTSQQMRLTHWDTFLRTYHDTIRKESSKFENVSIPSYEDVCEEFKFNSMLSFMVCSFFLPMMMEEKRKDRSEWTDTPTEEEMEEMTKFGGDKANKAVGEILIFMIDKGFI